MGRWPELRSTQGFTTRHWHHNHLETDVKSSVREQGPSLTLFACHTLACSYEVLSKGQRFLVSVAPAVRKTAVASQQDVMKEGLYTCSKSWWSKQLICCKVGLKWSSNINGFDSIVYRQLVCLLRWYWKWDTASKATSDAIWPSHCWSKFVLLQIFNSSQLIEFFATTCMFKLYSSKL